MRRTIAIISLLACCLILPAQTKSYLSVLSTSLELRRMKLPANADTVFDYDGYRVHVVRANSLYIHIGLDIFPAEMRQSIGEPTCELVESSLLARALKEHPIGLNMVKITKGTIADFRNIGPASNLSANNAGTGELTLAWTVDSQDVSVSVPVQSKLEKPQKRTVAGASGVSRTELENGFISALKHGDNTLALEQPEITDSLLEPYGDSLYILPGATYQNKDISSSVYFYSDSLLTPVWDVRYPAESIANLFLFTTPGNAGTKVNMTVLKHEYGDQEKVSTDVAQLMDVAAKSGFRPFWGTESVGKDKLEGSLFLYSQSRSYVHILKVTCNPSDVIAGTGAVTVRASLFVPTNNIHNLVAPYKKKKPSERIRYDK